MTDYIDPFDRKTLFEVLPSFHNNRVSFVIRKDRQSIFESWSIEVAKQIKVDLEEVIKLVEINKEKNNVTK